MGVISFPAFNLNLKVPQIAFTIFGIDIYSYSLCIIIGIVVAIFLCKKSEEDFCIKFQSAMEIMLFTLIISIIGARAYYVLFNLDYYLANPLKIFNIRDGGLAIYGGLLIGAWFITKLCKSYKIPVLDFFDYIVPFVAIAQSIGRWGNFFNREAFGYATNSIFRMGIDTVNGYMEVHPVFLYESIATFILYFMLRKAQKNRRFKGQVFYIYLMIYSGVRMYLEPLRSDSLMLGKLRISQILSIAIFIFSSVTLLLKYIRLAIKRLHKPKKVK